MTHTKHRHICMQLKDGVLQFQPTPDGHALFQQRQLAAKRAECGFWRHPSYDRQRASTSTRSRGGLHRNQEPRLGEHGFPATRSSERAGYEEIRDRSILPSIMMYRPLLHPWSESINTTVDRGKRPSTSGATHWQSSRLWASRVGFSGYDGWQ